MSTSVFPMKQNVSIDTDGSVSGKTQNRPMPVCWMPSRNLTSIDAPVASGVPGVTAPTDSVALKPPANPCVGGVSSVVPFTSTLDVPEPHGGRSTMTVVSADVRARRSATPAIDGNVLMSTIRNRSRVRLRPVLFFHVRRMSYVPNVELSTGSDVKSRTLFGMASVATQVSSRADARAPPPSLAIGDDRFSGPGAPSRWPAPAFVALVSTKMKSVELLLESNGIGWPAGDVVCISSTLLQVPLAPPPLPVQPPLSRRANE